MSHCTCDYHQEQNKNECFTDIKFEKDGSSSIELNYHIIDENDKCIRCGIFVHGMIEMVTNICPKSLKYIPPKKRQLGDEHTPLFTEEQKKELRDSIMRKK